MSRTILLGVAAIAVILAALGFFLSIPQPTSASGQAMRLPVDPVPLVAMTDKGARSFSIEIADDQSERAAGLMFRESMDDERGMLFVFEQTRPAGFWMKNTPMPLDLLFIGEDGGLVAILPGEPFSEAPIGPAAPVRFVLELKRGVAERSGISVGDRLRHPQIDAVAGREDVE